MARTESIASGGYFPTPPEQIPRIAALLKLTEYDDEAARNVRLSVLDPCAGEGTALFEITRLITLDHEKQVARLVKAQTKKSRQDRRAHYTQMAEGYTGRGEEVPDWIADVISKKPEDEEPEAEEAEVKELQKITCAEFYAIEMEQKRFEELKKHFNDQSLLHGDAFRAFWKADEDDGVGLLFLNPPYDLDKVCGRLEEKFLRRFTSALAPGGVLVFLVPYYALSASAETFAKSYEDVSCYRFAGEGFNIFKQVVVFARKLPQDRIEPDAQIRDMVNLWAAHGSECPELPDADKPHRRPIYDVPMHDRHAKVLEDWKMRVVDVAAILGKYVPWHESTRRGGLQPLSRVVPSFALVDCMHRTYEVATPPRPAHIAAGLAAGLFNGQRIEPDDEASKLPSLLVKGVFDREWRTIEEKHSKEGEKTGEVQVQAPRLVVTVLDLREHSYHQLRQDAQQSKKAPTSAADLSVGDLLGYYGRSLMGVMERQCVILYDPRRDAGKFDLYQPTRPLYDAQKRAVEGLLTVLTEKEGERSPLCLGEIGVGKSPTSLVAARS